MEKMTGESLNVTDQNIKIIAEHFPEAMEEGKIKFDVLKELLGEFIDESNERYQFTWNGKSQALKLSQTPSTGTLLPCKEKSKDWDTTENLYIEGDNLEVLKLLQKSYYKKVKMIYIDPPYNTGNDFVYKDDYEKNIKDYKNLTLQNCKANPEINGRYHTDWLNMIYPRLKLAKNLLTDDGLIFISIDDNEQSNLKKVCDEIFGESNFVNCIAVKMSEASGVKMAHEKYRFPKIKEYVLLYKKPGFKGFECIDKYKIHEWDNENNIFLDNLTSEDRARMIEIEGKDEISESALKEIKNILKKVKKIPLNKKIEDLKLTNEKDIEKWCFENAFSIIKTAGSSSLLKLVKEKGIDSQQEISAELSSTGVLFYYITDFNIDSKQPRLQVIFADSNIYKNPCDLWQDIKTTGGIALEGGVQYNNGKKPLKLIQRMIKMTTKQDDIILDFFSGSSSTAHAVLSINSIKEENRKFIMVQVDEDLDISIKEASGDNKKTIQETIDFLDSCNRPHILSELGMERIIRSSQKIKEETNADIDYGFKVFKLDSSNLKLWNGDFKTEEEANNYFLEHLSPLVDGRTKEDLLYELLLKEGMSLTSPIEEIKAGDKIIYSIGMGYLMICLEEKIDMNVVEEIGKRKPESIIFRDSGFVDENAKINTIQELKKYGIAEEVIKSI